jgi:hypothetical protein
VSRVPVGRLNGLEAEPGTILGPDTAGELMVVLERDERGVTCGYANTRGHRQRQGPDGGRRDAALRL